MIVNSEDKNEIESMSYKDLRNNKLARTLTNDVPTVTKLNDIDKFTSNKEKFILNIFEQYISLMNCAESLEDSITFIEYTDENIPINIDRYINYHYEAFLNKIPTIRDILYSFINILLNLEVKNTSYENGRNLILKKIQEMDCHNVEDVLKSFDQLFSNEFNIRNTILHEGKDKNPYNYYLSALLLLNKDKENKKDLLTQEITNCRDKHLKILNLYKSNIYQMIKSFFDCASCLYKYAIQTIYNK